MAAPQLIGLFAPAERSGKTTAADYLVKHCGYTKVRFAGAIKAMIASLLAIYGYSRTAIQEMTDGEMKEDNIPELGVSTRCLMQTLGTEWGRKTIHDSIWINATLTSIQQILAEGGKVVVDDVRFINEAKALKEFGGYLVEIDRGVASVHSHVSEGGMLGYQGDRTIKNTSDLSSLYREIDDMVNGIDRETLSDEPHAITPEVSNFLMGLIDQMITDGTNKGTLMLDATSGQRMEIDMALTVIPRKVH